MLYPFATYSNVNSPKVLWIKSESQKYCSARFRSICDSTATKFFGISWKPLYTRARVKSPAGALSLSVVKGDPKPGVTQMFFMQLTVFKIETTYSKLSWSFH